jgi:hypothetical protein
LIGWGGVHFVVCCMTNFMGLNQDVQEAYYAKHPGKKQLRELRCV